MAIKVNTGEQVKSEINKVKTLHPSARHHCYAYRIGVKGETYRANDDGEPSGTAGKPILGQLLSFEVTNVLIIVIRYFGGTKLGVSGLINAYKNAAKNALEYTKIVKEFRLCSFEVIFEHDKTNAVMTLLKEYKCDYYDQLYDNQCRLKFDIRLSLLHEFENRLKGLYIDLTELN